MDKAIAETDEKLSRWIKEGSAEKAEKEPKYSRFAPFTDPVLRCDGCNKLVLHASIRKLGMCQHCGNRRFRNVMIMNDDEVKQVNGWGVDPDWMALFEPVEEGDL